jgi:hypothetical protein
MIGLPRLGEYESVRVIASGGMGVVVEVTHSRTGVSYAGKIIHKAEDPLARERFRREAELLARCDRHPGIVTVHTVGETATGSPYMILDLIQGESLDALLDRERKLDPRRAATIARDVARALGFTHDRGIVHRDVKPGNILLDESGTPHLTDFGLATARDLERLTVSGSFLGTPRYISPEQARGTPTSPASDVFSLGCVLFHALSGRPPIAAESIVGLLTELASETPLDRLEDHAAGVPADLAAIVARTLRKDPLERYENGSALARELDAHLEGRAVDAVSHRAKRRAALVLSVLALSTLVLASTALAILGARRSHRAREALAAAREELAKARAALDRTAPGPDLAPADDHARRAAVARDLAASQGADRDAALDTALDALATDLALARARDRLARGDAAAALAALDAAAGALGEPGHLVRARALLALERHGDALRELEGLDRAEPLELAGDVLLALDRPGESARAYGRALALAATKDARRVRAKRGGAAALAGDGEVAAADLTALLGEPIALGAATVASVGSIAPVLYLRGLAAEDPRVQEQDLEAAWRLGPPPRRLAAPVARAWVARAATGTSDWVQGVSEGLPLTEGRVRSIEAVLARAARARAIDPATSLRPLDDPILNLLPFVMNTDKASAPAVVAVLRRLLALFPDSARLFYLLACATRPLDDLPAILEALDRAVDLSPDPAPDDTSERAFAREIANLMTEADGTLAIDVERLRRTARRADCAESWWQLSEALSSRRLDAEALDACARAAAATSAIGRPVPKETLGVGRAVLIARSGRLEDAIVVLRELRESNPVDPSTLGTLASYLTRAARWDEIVGLVDLPSAARSPIAPGVARALARTGRVAEAHALVARIGLRPGDPIPELLAVDETERSAEALLSQGKTDEAIALVREVVARTKVGEATGLLAATLNRCGRPEEVAELADRGDLRAMAEKALALVKLGNRDAARVIVANLRRDGYAYEARPIEAALAARDR